MFLKFKVLKVTAFNAIRTKVKHAVITEWTGIHGTCDRQIFFDNTVLSNGLQPVCGSKVSCWFQSFNML